MSPGATHASHTLTVLRLPQQVCLVVLLSEPRPAQPRRAKLGQFERWGLALGVSGGG